MEDVRKLWKILETNFVEGVDSAKPKGVTFHLIETAHKIGEGRSLEGFILAEKEGGSLHKIDGKELVDLAEKAPWIKKWKLSEDEFG